MNFTMLSPHYRLMKCEQMENVVCNGYIHFNACQSLYLINKATPTDFKRIECIKSHFVVQLKGLILIFHQASATKKMSVALQCATMNKIQEPKSALRVSPVRCQGKKLHFYLSPKTWGQVVSATESRIFK